MARTGLPASQLRGMSCDTSTHSFLLLSNHLPISHTHRSPFLLTRYPLLPLCGLRVLCGSFPSVNRAICNPQSPDLSGVTTKTQKHEAAVTSSPLVSLCLRGSHDPQSAIANPSPRSLRLLPHIALDKISKIMYNPVKTSRESIHCN